MAWYKHYILAIEMSKQLKEAARKLRIKNVANVTDNGGLVPPKNKAAAHPFLWNDPNTQKPPEVIRWVWSPTTGEMRLGPASHHAEQIGRDQIPFDGWVRGFYFPARKQIAVRPYFWPQGPYDDWDASHAELNDQVRNTITNVLRSAVPNANIQTEVGNSWLQNNIDQRQRW